MLIHIFFSLSYVRYKAPQEYISIPFTQFDCFPLKMCVPNPTLKIKHLQPNWICIRRYIRVYVSSRGYYVSFSTFGIANNITPSNEWNINLFVIGHDSIRKHIDNRIQHILFNEQRHISSFFFVFSAIYVDCRIPVAVVTRIHAHPIFTSYIHPLASTIHMT